MWLSPPQRMGVPNSPLSELGVRITTGRSWSRSDRSCIAPGRLCQCSVIPVRRTGQAIESLAILPRQPCTSTRGTSLWCEVHDTERSLTSAFASQHRPQVSTTAVKSFVACSVAALALVDCASAIKAYLSYIPNGPLFSQELGHPDNDSSQYTNFATAFEAVGLSWTADFCADTFPNSDMTNGAAFGDPCCTWTQGGTPDFTVTAFTTDPTTATVCATASSTTSSATTSTDSSAATATSTTSSATTDASTTSTASSSTTDSSTTTTTAPTTESTTSSATTDTTTTPSTNTIGGGGCRAKLRS